MAQPKPQWPHQPTPGLLLREASRAPHHRRQRLPAATLLAPEHRGVDGTARGARATAPPRHRATAPPRHRAAAPPRHRATAPPRRRATAPPRRRAATPPDAAASPRRNAATPPDAAASPRRNAVVPPVAPPIVSCSRLHRAVQSAAQQPQPPVVPWLHVTPPSPPPAFGAGLGQRRIRLLERGARWCAARQLPRERRRQQIVRQGADTRRLRPLGRRRAGHDGRELRHAQWPRDQLAGRGKHAQRVGLLAAAELATYGSRRPLSPLCMAARLALLQNCGRLGAAV